MHRAACARWCGVAAIVPFIVLTAVPPVMACGASAPGTPVCGTADETGPSGTWHAGFAGVFTSTVVRFPNMQVGETRYTGMSEISYAVTSRLSLAAGLGVVAQGRELAPDGTHQVMPGISSSVDVSYRFLDVDTPLGQAFVLAGGGLSFAEMSTRMGSDIAEYDALDGRACLAAGLTWLRSLNAYGLARAFEGPVFWRYGGTSEVGSDTHHYQVGGGLALSIRRRVDAFAEGTPLGAQSVAVGASLAF